MLSLHRALCCTGVVAVVATTGACNSLLGIDDVDPIHDKKAMTLTQTDSQSITFGITCGDVNMFTLENSFYRRFTLPDYRAIDGFVVKGVSFGVYFASSNLPSLVQPLDIFLYEDTGTQGIDPNKLVAHGHATVGIPDTATPKGATFEFNPVVNVPGPVLVVELRVVATSAQMRKLEIGVNLQPEAASAYRRAPQCGNEVPVPLDTIPKYVDVALVLSVFGDG